MSDVDAQARPRRADGIEVNDVPDGYIVYQTAGERVTFLNPTAAFIFELCDGRHTTDEIESIFLEAFEDEASDAAIVRQCLASLLEEGILVR